MVTDSTVPSETPLGNVPVGQEPEEEQGMDKLTKCGATHLMPSRFEGPPYVVTCNRAPHDGPEHSHEFSDNRITWTEGTSSHTTSTHLSL